MVQSKRLAKEDVEKDRFAEAILGGYVFLKENLKPIIFGVAIVILVVGVVAVYQHQQREKRAEAFLKYMQVVEKYQEAENDWLDSEETETNGEQFEAIATQFQTIFQKYSGTSVADKARYTYAKTRYYQKDYDGAITQFQAVIGQHQPENHVLALYAQKAIGNCYEQKGEYQRAIDDAYTVAEDDLPPIAMRGHVLADLQLSQARCYEKLGDFDNALAVYKDLIDLFRDNLRKAIQQKGLGLINKAKPLIETLSQPPNVTEAERLESEANYYDAFVSYAETIHNYKVDKDIHGGLTKGLRERIHRFEIEANDFRKTLRDARRYESEERNSTALYYYGQAVSLDFAPSRKVYEKSLLCRDKIQRKQLTRESGN